jgi:hypothetical protein
LADVATKLVATHLNTLPETEALRITIGEIAPRPAHWVIYTLEPSTPTLALSQTLAKPPSVDLGEPSLSITAFKYMPSQGRHNSHYLPLPTLSSSPLHAKGSALKA